MSGDSIVEKLLPFALITDENKKLKEGIQYLLDHVEYSQYTEEGEFYLQCPICFASDLHKPTFSHQTGCPIVKLQELVK